MDKKAEGTKLSECGFNCSQSVFGVFAEELGLNQETALKISTAFGGGMRKAEVCGAVTGALMTLGLQFGQGDVGSSEKKVHTYALTNDFIKRFEEKNRSIICKELLGYDLSKPEEMKILQELGSFKTQCPKLVKDAIEITEIMMKEAN